MTLRDFTGEEWEQLRADLRAFRGSLLEHAIRAWVISKHASYDVDLESEKTPYDRTQYVRGLRAGLQLALRVFDELERKSAPPPRQP